MACRYKRYIVSISNSIGMRRWVWTRTTGGAGVWQRIVDGRIESTKYPAHGFDVLQQYINNGHYIVHKELS